MSMARPAAKSTAMDYLVDRIRLLLDGDPRVTEKMMFGGLTFLLNNHILVGCRKDGRILLSVGKANNDEALARPGATQMIHGERTMTGFIWVEADAVEDDDALEDWVRIATRWVEQMPIEERKARPLRGRKTPAKR